MANQPPTLFPDLDLELPSRRGGGGVLPSQMIEAAIEAGYLSSAAPISAAQVQPASLDLRLGRVVYRVRSSFLSGERRTVSSCIEDLKLSELDLSSGAVLESGAVYVAPIMEELRLPRHLSGRANAKSTTGRLDIFARLITDYGSQFDRVPSGYRGKLFIELVPRTFSVRVRSGAALNQLRLIRGNPVPSDAVLAELHESAALVYQPDCSPANAKIHRGLTVSVSLKGPDASRPIGFRAKKDAPLVDLDARNVYKPADFWEPLFAGKSHTLILKPEEFYVLGSRERISIPPDFAADMVPYDPALGEFRIHYAGFLDPGFGYGEVAYGTAAVLQARSHEAPFALEDGQPVGRLVFERLLETPAKLYGAQIGSSYQQQHLSLSKQFRPWPSDVDAQV